MGYMDSRSWDLALAVGAGGVPRAVAQVRDVGGLRVLRGLVGLDEGGGTDDSEAVDDELGEVDVHGVTFHRGVGLSL